DEQRLSRIQVTRRFNEIGPVDVRYEPERHRAFAVVLQRLVSHDRAEIGAADADIDDVSDALARMALPRAAAHAVGERAHPIENGMDLRHNVLAIDDDRGVARRPERDMQHSAPLRDIDLVAAEHRVDAVAQARLLRKLNEQFDGLVGNAILGVVERNAGSRERESFAPPRIVRKELTQMERADRLLMGQERSPRGPPGEGRDYRVHCGLSPRSLASSAGGGRLRRPWPPIAVSSSQARKPPRNA